MKLAESRRASLDNGGLPCLPIGQSVSRRACNVFGDMATHLRRSPSVNGRRRMAASFAISSSATLVHDGGLRQVWAAAVE